MTQTPKESTDFIAFVRSASQQLKDAESPTSEWRGENGAVAGWRLKREDLPSHADEQVGRTPYYMGGDWGHRVLILGEDGFIYEYLFQGQDTWDGEQIVGHESQSIRKRTLVSLRGRGKPFNDVRRQIDGVLAKLHEW